MRSYTIKFKNGKTKELEVADKNELIEREFSGSEEQFKDEVESLRWKTPSLLYVENVDTGEIDSKMITADTNPYGWRNEAKG